MHATPSSQVRPVPSGAPDPTLQAGLAELFQLGLTVARASARLAEIEGLALEALAEAAAEATKAAASNPASLADAIEASNRAEASDAIRNTIAARMACITDCFDKAARAVRRTAALQARLADGRSFHEQPSAEGTLRGVPGTSGRAANDAERSGRLDEPESGNEISGQANEDVVRAIHRDLDQATIEVAAPARSITPQDRPRIVRPPAEAPMPPMAPPKPDT
jgi:hypothetical protein